MAIIISPAERTDIKSIIRLNEAAFPSLYHSILFDGPLAESTVEALAEQQIQSLFKEEERSEDQETAQKIFKFKAVKDSTGEIVGEAHWVIYYEDKVLTKTVEEEVKDRISPVMPQMQVQTMSEFARIVATTKREVLAVPSETGETGDSHTAVKLRKMVYLHNLAVHPNHQRMGIGRKLLQWGLDEADRLGLIIYLEASREGIRLYEQAGFQKVKDVNMDLIPFGAKENLPIRLMLRHPKS